MDPLAAAPPTTRFPTWARRGSYLVVRRLLQDVPAFWAFAAESARTLGTTTEHGAALMVGRWPSGAPLMRAPTRRRCRVGRRRARREPLPLQRRHPPGAAPARRRRPCGRPPPGRGRHRRPRLPARRAHPEDEPARQRDRLRRSGRHADSADARRGIPFGDAGRGRRRPVGRADRHAERGLMFAAYMGSIEDQFEFVSRRWANSTVQPERRRPRPDHRPARTQARAASEVSTCPMPRDGSSRSPAARSRRARSRRQAAATSSCRRSPPCAMCSGAEPVWQGIFPISPAWKSGCRPVRS